MASSKVKVKRVKMNVKEKIILALVIIVGLMFLGYVGKFYLRQWTPLTESEGVLEKDENTYELKEESTLIDDGLDLDQLIEGQFTVLAIGFDEEGQNTDVMMLFMFDIKGKEINILQIPRDTYVGGSTTGKINSVYSYGDEDLTPINRVVQAVRDMTQIPIDRYIAINCNDIPPVVDAMGGIPINVPETIVYSDTKIIEAGEQVLTGEQSEWFVRFRHDYTEGDIGRVKAQRIFMAAAMNKLKDMGSVEFLKIFPTVQKYIMSDMSLGEIASIADFAEDVSMEDVTVRMVPGEGLDPEEYNGYYIYSVHAQELADMLNEYFRPYQRDVDVDELDVIELKNTEEYYDDVVDNFQDIIDGDTPEIPRNES
ncbi:MAG: LCP family protein [Ruminococcus sp.]|nr:LCP family protein [Ruminococcus sp.]MCD7799953.1 LCP family protein [Ruminococcus sp.]